MHWVAAIDSYLSGWGDAGGRTSIYLVECETPEEVTYVVSLLQKRPEMRSISIHESDTVPYYDPNEFQVTRRNKESAPMWYQAEPIQQEQTQQEKYVAAGGSHCPQCGAEDYSGEGVEVNGPYAFQRITCSNCGASWEDHYVLTGFTLIEEGKHAHDN